MKKEPTDKQEPQQGIVQPIIEDLISTAKPSEVVPQQPPPKAAELDQDPGGGFNPDHTDIQT